MPIGVADVWKQSSNAFLDFAGVRSTYLGLAPGAKIAAYVHASGAASTDFQEIKSRIYTTLNSALAQCRENKGDVVFVLPGHTENVATADSMTNLVAGTRIVGGGHGNLRPIFTWSTAASTFLLDVANVSLENLILEMAGPAGAVAITVAAPMTISAAGCSLVGCKLHTEIDADQASTIAVTTTAAADDLTIANCHFYGSGDGTLPTTQLQLVGADRLKMFNNVFEGYFSNVAFGCVTFATTASTYITLVGNTYMHRLALSTCAVVGLADCSGVSRDEHFHYLDTASLTPWLTSRGAMTFHRPTVSNTTAETGTEVVGTVSA